MTVIKPAISVLCRIAADEPRGRNTGTRPTAVLRLFGFGAQKRPYVMVPMTLARAPLTTAMQCTHLPLGTLARLSLPPSSIQLSRRSGSSADRVGSVPSMYRLMAPPARATGALTRDFRESLHTGLTQRRRTMRRKAAHRASYTARTLFELKMCVSTNSLHSSLAPSASMAPSSAHQFKTSCWPASSTCFRVVVRQWS